MSIVFEPLPEHSGQNGSARLSLPRVEVRGGNVRGPALTLPAVRVQATGRVTRRGSAFLRLQPPRVAAGPAQRAALVLPPTSVYGRDLALTPQLAIAQLTSVPVQVSARGRITRRGTGAVVLQAPRLFATDMHAVGRVQLAPLQVAGYTLPPIVRYLSAYQSPGYVYATLGSAIAPRAVLRDSLALGGAPGASLISRLIEHLALSAEPASVLAALAQLSDAVEFVDRLGIIWRMLVSDAVALDGAPKPSIVSAARLVEVLHLIAGPGSSLSARNVVAETLALNDTLAIISKEQLSDGAAFAGAFSTHLTARIRALDELLLAGQPVAGLRVHAAVSDTLALGDAPTSAAQMLAHLQDTVGFAVTLRLGDDLYVAWVVNTETRAATQYENFPFNSFAALDGRYFAAADDGVYRLGGDQDDGEAIRARFRVGLNNLGTGKEKRMPAMYWGYRADGGLVLKVITTEPTGEKVENWYALRPRGAGAPREGRTQIGRGIKAVFWDFEVENLDGSDFEIDSLELYPMILDRRVRGRDG